MEISLSNQHFSTLTAESVTVARGDRTIIDGLSFAARAGEALLLVGPNGAGKTSLLRALAGLLPWASGELRLVTRDGRTEPWYPSGSCHFVGHALPVKPKLTVFENAEFWCEYLAPAAGRSDDRIMPALEAFDLMDLGPVPAAYLSAGQRRRLSLTRLLLADRPVWLLDEPTTSLDRASVERLTAAIESHLQAGGIVVAATHQPLPISHQRILELNHATGTE